MTVRINGGLLWAHNAVSGSWTRHEGGHDDGH
jgi:hypothetical protein